MNRKKLVLQGITFAIFFACFIVFFLMTWVFRTWNQLDMEQLVYQLKVSAEGAGNHIVLKGVLWTFVPAIVAEALLVLAVIKVKRRRILCIGMWFLAVFMVCFGMYSWNRLKVSAYVAAVTTDSDFIETNYVDPEDVAITFPEEKRNLIYIFLESMEITYADEASGGAFAEDVIPELTQLAVEHENFSGADDALNGGYAMSGATWTVAGMFAQTAGLPLKISLDGNSMSTQSDFFPAITTIGDILEAEGYRNVLMIGSSAAFAGRDHYFTSHGEYELLDYNYAIANGWIPEDYYVFWGYEDEKLFEHAKSKLLELSASDEPFNFTMLTVDTHFEDGYVCELCDSSFGDNQYANVMRCSAKQVSEFVEWVQQQEFYENTTIVISGDHLTMDGNFCENVGEDYERKVYTAYINSAIEPESGDRREYTTMDAFPTTLEALGAAIEGRRLGLGTSLFSSVPTLLETYGYEELNSELSKASSFMEELNSINYDELAPLAGASIAKITSSQLGVRISCEGADIGTVYVLAYDENDSLIYKQEGQSEDDFFIFNKNDLPENASYLKVSYIFEGDTKKNEYNVDAFYFYPQEWTYYWVHATFSGCLDYLAENEDYYVLMAICDEGTSNLTESMIEGLETLGFHSSLFGTSRISFIGVARGGSAIVDESAYEELTASGTFDNGVTFQIASAGLGVGNYASIVIDGADVTPGGRGINIVVYDSAANQVIDALTFDTYAGCD